VALWDDVASAMCTGVFDMWVRRASAPGRGFVLGKSLVCSILTFTKNSSKDMGSWAQARKIFEDYRHTILWLAFSLLLGVSASDESATRVVFTCLRAGSPL
jgi:hypothetical protein